MEFRIDFDTAPCPPDSPLLEGPDPGAAITVIASGADQPYVSGW